MDEVFHALADPSRRRLLDRLNEHGGQNLRELCAGLDMARQSVSKHLAVLEAANLVTTVWRGREKLHYLNAAPINDIAERWITAFDRGRVEVLADLKRALEDTSLQRSEFVYTTYIRTTAERLWQALTDPAFTRRYWQGITFKSDWAVGSPLTLERDGAPLGDPLQVVLESDPYRRLSYTWHVTAANEPRSRVTFDLEPHGQLVKLTVVQGAFEPDSPVLARISDGWPRVLSNLKTLLETGETLPDGTDAS